jgi:hypothetical protein
LVPSLQQVHYLNGTERATEHAKRKEMDRVGFEIVLFHPIAAAPLDAVGDSSFTAEVVDSNPIRLHYSG